MLQDEETVSVIEVDAALCLRGFDPGAIREFAWELVCQDLADNLPPQYALRSSVLMGRLCRLVSTVAADPRIDDEMLAKVLESIADSLYSRRHRRRSASSSRTA